MLNIEEIKMQNKTVSKILVAIIMTSMLLAILPALPVGATTLASITPTSGNVGTVVRVIGMIDTQGGQYSIYFDTNSDGNALNDGAIKTANAPANSYAVNDTFTIPACLGSDAGSAHPVLLRDDQTATSQSASFAVITKRTVTTAARAQEGDVMALTVTVTGGTTALTSNNFTIGVTDPAGTMYTDANFSFTTSTQGSGAVTKNFPSSDFTTGTSTNMTGTYTVSGNRTLPGAMTNVVSTSFIIGLTNATTYGRFQTVNVQTAGWANNQNVTITITNTTGGIAQQWADLNLTTGTTNQNWTVPWNAPMGTYTATVVNATGNNKAIASTQTFTVGSAALAIAYTVNPSTPLMRTQTATANFTITYPDATLLNTTQFSSISVDVYANTTLVDTIVLTAANYDSTTATWRVSWKIPRDAARGTGYTFRVSINNVVDTFANSGPTAAASSSTFTVTAATLGVMITQQPAANYTRTGSAMAKINITYPDTTFYTDADLGTILVRVNQSTTNVANVSLVAGDFNSTTNDWTISWASPFNATLAADYTFQILTNEVVDGTNPNTGPTSTVSTNAFEILNAVINVASVDTDKTTYRPGEYVILSFVATYDDGSPVVTGASSITLAAPDGFTTMTKAPVHTTAGTWAITIWLSDAQAQLGSWNITLNVNGLTDGAGNTGPAVARTNSFTVLESEVTLETLSAELQALETKINTITTDVNGMKAAINSLTSAVSSQTSDITSIKTAGTALAADIDMIDEVLGYTAGVVAELQTALGTLSTTAATKTEVAAVSSVVSGLSADLTALKSSVAALNTAVADTASTADVDTTVNEAVDAAVTDLTADIAALETSLNALSNTVDNAATQADLDAAASDLDSSIAGLNTMVIIAVVLALIAAIAAIAAVFIIQRKIAG